MSVILLTWSFLHSLSQWREKCSILSRSRVFVSYFEVLSPVSSVSLHFLSLWLSALFLIVYTCVIASLALIVSTCVIASPALMVSTCVITSLPLLCPPVSRSPVSNHLHFPCVCVCVCVCVSPLFWAKDNLFSGKLLAFKSYLSLTTTNMRHKSSECIYRL